MYGEIRSRRLLSESRVCSGRLLLEVHCGVLEGMAPGMAIVLGSPLVLRRSCRRLGDSCGRRGGCCGRYRPLCPSWRSAEGSAGVGLSLVNVLTTFEGCAHARRGFCSRGGYEELAAQRQEQHQACLHRASQVPTGSEQHRGWWYRDQSWRMGLWSRHAVWHGGLM